jgi:chemotaxis signal transduction protein
MSTKSSCQYPYIVFSLNKKRMAISSENIQSMVITPEASFVPHTPDYVRGVVNLRGSVIPLIDLRMRLGMPSFLEEIKDFCSLMDQREQDHKNWLIELEASIKENRDFALATDPHKCAFGKWYDNYEPESYAVSSLLMEFDAPHQRIHGIAEKVISLEKEGKLDAACKVIEECHDNELAEMIKLFASVKKAYRAKSNEVSIVVESDTGNLAITVDDVESIEHFTDDNMEDTPDGIKENDDTGFVKKIAKRKIDKAVILILDMEEIYSD